MAEGSGFRALVPQPCSSVGGGGGCVTLTLGMVLTLGVDMPPVLVAIKLGLESVQGVVSMAKG